MLNNNAIGSMALSAVFFAVLIPDLGFASSVRGPTNHNSEAISSGCSTVASAITLSNVPSRITGVAPLSVFFDASSTIANTRKRPFHDLEYRWDFGDPAGSPVNGATWNAGSRAGISSRNTATGPEAAHVFEIPGIYTVALTATDGKNTASNNCTRIVVQNPDIVFAGTNTICIGAASTPKAGVNGCPSGALTVMQSSFPAAVNTYALTGKRVLFKRGDTFTAATSARITSTGPGTLGAYGTGAMPKVQMMGNTTVLMLSSRLTPTIKDWRIMNLEFDGMSQAGAVGVNTDGGINQVTILNMNIHDIGNGVLFNDSIIQWWYLKDGLTQHAMFDEIAIVGSIITPIFNSTTGWRIFASANRGSIQGNTLGNMINNSSMGSHVLRVPHMAKGVIANNTIARPGQHQLAIKLHAQAWCLNTSAPGTCYSPNNDPVPLGYNYINNTHPIGIFATLSGYTEQVVISDNKIIGADNPYSMSVASENLQNDERLRDIIVERNFFTSGTATQLSLLFNAENITIRNNIANMTLGLYKTFASVFDPGTAPPSKNVQVLNNTIYGGSGVGSEFFGVVIDPAATNVAVINNLFTAPSQLNPVMISGTGASGLVQSNNILTNTPATLFVSATPSAPADFRLNSTSPARDEGLSTVPVRSSFFLAGRSQGIMDIGAVEMP
ncbi:MAG: PKD domain-containing protein [Candidatus Nitrotoga sp.]